MPLELTASQAAPLDDLELEIQGTAVAATPAPTTETPPKPTIPNKYEGKSLEDLIAMHQNAERRMSQMGSEVGALRALSDQLIGIKQPKENATAQKRTPVTVDALLADPDSVLTQTLAASPVAQRQVAQDERLNNLEQSISQQNFVRSYPSFQADMDNPAFMDWVQRNHLRTQLAQKAYNKDFGAATDLWSLWTEEQSRQTPEAKAAKQKTLAAAKTVKGGADGEAAPRKKYSREKLMDLRMRVQEGDAAAIEKWNNKSFQEALVVAYANGDVE